MKIFKIILLTFLSIIFITACDYKSADGSKKVTVSQRIINGNANDWNQAPQFVRLLINYKSGETSLCTGTIISSDSVLTAGHCFSEPVESVIADTINGSFPATEVIVSPDYRIDYNLLVIFNDVAIVKTVPHGLPALPVLYSAPVLEQDNLLVYGFGLDENNEFGPLKSGFITASLVTGNHILTTPFTGEGVNPCNGDSGTSTIKTIETETGPVSGITGIVSTGTTETCYDGDINYLTNVQNESVLNFILTYCSGVVVL